MKKNGLSVSLTIAGSDSGGGAGIQADLKTMQALGVFGTSAITALTCQNTTGVSAVQAVDPRIVRGQILDVLSDFPVASLKTGMLFSREIIESVGEIFQREPRASSIPRVVDPVMVATSGARLLQKEAEDAMIEFLSLATLITPNIPEAELILGGVRIENEDQLEDAAKAMYKKTKVAVLLKGGHLKPDSQSVVDLYYDGTEIERFVSSRIHHGNTHGTGCTLSSAIASYLAKGASLSEAVRRGREYLHGAIVHAPNLGAGSGPLNHMWITSGES